MAKQYYIRQAGKTYGPYSSTQVKKLVADGKVQRDATVSESKDGPWHAISKVVPKPPEKSLPAVNLEPVNSPMFEPVKPVQASQQPQHAPYAPPVTQPQTTQVFVNQQPSNGIGMVGFVLSIVSWVSCGILFPLALLFSFVGVFFKPRAYAVAGLCISGGAAAFLVVCWFLFLGAFFTGVTALSIVLTEAQVEMAKQNVSNTVRIEYLEKKRLPTKEEFDQLDYEDFVYEPTGDTKVTFTHWGRDQQHGTEDDQTFDVDFAKYRLKGTGSVDPGEFGEFGKPLKVGDVEVTVTKAEVGLVRLKNFNGETTSEDQLLAISISITNKSNAAKIDYRSWSETQILGSSGRLADDLNNTYRRISFGVSEVVGACGNESIYPGKTIEDVLVFEVPIEKASSLTLNLDAENCEQDGHFMIRIPIAKVEGR